MKLLHLTSLAGLISTSLALWPEPKEYKLGESTLWLAKDFQFSLEASGAKKRTTKSRSSALPSVDEIIDAAIDRTQKEISQTEFVPWKFHPRNVTFEPDSKGQGTTISQVVIKQGQEETFNSTRDFLTKDESYGIEISEDGEAVITSSTAIGTLRGLQTFQQLFYAHSSGNGVYTPYAPVSITDSPKWPHRGLNLDIARNPFRPADVKRVIDALSTAKMSRLHVHATDSQAWPLEIPSIPELAEKGAYHPALIWTASNLEEVQLYGLERGVSVFIEIDMPGHTASIAHAFPELITAFNIDDWSTYALEPPSGQLKLDSPEVNDFLDQLMSDLLPRVSQYSPYFHTGGDELNLNAYNLDETVNSNKTEVIQPLVQELVTRLHNHLLDNDLTPIVWEEMLIDFNLTFPAGKENVIIQVWQESSTLQTVLSQGYRALFGDYHHWYLDCGHGGFINPLPGSTSVVDPYVDYCSPMKNWRHIYAYNPLADVDEELHHLIHGGEAHLWAEQSDPSNLDTMLWPRAATAGEVMWSGPRDKDSIKDASFRLGEWRERIVVDKGITAGMVGMTMCLMDEGSCEL
ncbi:N-acetyl-glucosamine-6-phosphate deacetylase [Arachnomyces sp. PD_36]|nr:N-acetyl-glucosamine-6-phosphate deacetylase [Arachnomyces sp. PD_36]